MVHRYHHVMPPARISLTLTRHFSLSFIAIGRSSGLHPVSSQSCCKYVRAGRPAFARPYVGVHRRTSLMSSSLLPQPCPACLVRLTWIVFVMRGRWPYGWCFVGCCLQDLFYIARSINGYWTLTAAFHYPDVCSINSKYTLWPRSKTQLGELVWWLISRSNWFCLQSKL